MTSEDEFYRLAGELFGRLRKALGFGELVMLTKTWGTASGVVRCVAYQWTFNAKGKVYCCEYTLDREELETLPIDYFADGIAERWKRQHNRQTETTDAPNP